MADAPSCYCSSPKHNNLDEKNVEKNTEWNMANGGVRKSENSIINNNENNIRIGEYELNGITKIRVLFQC